MRRFIDTVAGKALCHLAAMALVLPTVTLTVAARAEAQVTQLPSWAVTEFKDLHAANSRYGQVAADAVSGELAKTNRYDVIAQETIKRSLDTLGLSSPLEGLVNLNRVGQDIRADVIVQGEVADYQVRAVGGGKQAIVVMRLTAIRVASGLPVNGALVRGESTIRGGNVTNEALINDAISQASADAILTMSRQQLPTATVLNTQVRTALINQGTRSGFKTGDTVTLTRGSIQVGTARIGVVEPDQAEITYERITRGVAPGDRVDAIFTVPALPAFGGIIKADGTANTGGSRPRGRSNNATLISALLVVGLVAVLLSSGNSNGTEATAQVRAEPTLDLSGVPANRISWSANGFFKGSGSSGSGISQWQIYRQDVATNPVLIVAGPDRSVLDSVGRNNSISGNYARFQNRVGGTTCDFQNPTDATFVTATTATARAGVPYYYRIEAVYYVLGIDTPAGNTGSSGGNNTGGNTGTTNGSTGNNTGNSAGNTTGSNNGGNNGTTNGGTAGGTNGTTGTSGTNAGTQLCYFKSGLSTTGQATPLNKPTLNPTGGTFPNLSASFTGVTTAGVSINAVYVVEFSDSRDFPKGSTVRTPQGTVTAGTTTFRFLATNSDLFTSRLRNASPIFYRIGVRNQSDRPGPVKNGSSNQRYIYSDPAQFTRPLTPP